MAFLLIGLFLYFFLLFYAPIKLIRRLVKTNRTSWQWYLLVGSFGTVLPLIFLFSILQGFWVEQIILIIIFSTGLILFINNFKHNPNNLWALFKENLFTEILLSMMPYLMLFLAFCMPDFSSFSSYHGVCYGFTDGEWPCSWWEYILNSSLGMIFTYYPALFGCTLNAVIFFFHWFFVGRELNSQSQNVDKNP